MEIIVMSTPGCWKSQEWNEANTEREVQLVTELFDNGLEHFHLRKPMYSVDQLRNWLTRLHPKYMRRVVLHTFHDLALDFDLGGIHLSERQRKRCLQSREQVDFLTKQLGHLKLSSSFHSLVDIRFAPKIYQYAFISPVFDSVSKPHHTAAFHRDELERTIESARNKVIALGGVTPERVSMAEQMGFDGVGVLGSLWNADQPLDVFKQFIKLRKREEQAPTLQAIG